MFDVTTKEEFNVGFKNYDELIFARNSNDISPFTETQWDLMMKFYKIMVGISGSLILISVVVLAYKMIISGFSIEKRKEVKDSMLRMFFGVSAITLAPIFVKFLLFLNNNLVKMLVGYSTNSLDEILGNNVISNIKTGNAIATSIVIAMFAYLFFKINVKFIIRQFTILIFTIFTPIVSILWMINRRTNGASLWFGQILINVFMQFIYAFLFLVYMKFLPASGGWATSILWAMMILPIANVLQNVLQNLVSRVAGLNNEEMSNRAIGMAGAMAFSIKAIAYQFKNPASKLQFAGSNLIGRIFNKSDIIKNQMTEMPKTEMEKTPMEKTKLSGTKVNESPMKEEPKSPIKTGIGKAVLNTGKELANLGMYGIEGRSFRNNKSFGEKNISKTENNDELLQNKQNIMEDRMKYGERKPKK